MIPTVVGGKMVKTCCVLKVCRVTGWLLHFVVNSIR